jgi:hypothetical protein
VNRERAITEVRCAVLENAWEYGHSTARASRSTDLARMHVHRMRRVAVRKNSRRVPISGAAHQPAAIGVAAYLHARKVRHSIRRSAVIGL